MNPTLQGYAAAVMEAADPSSLAAIADDLAAIEREALGNPPLRAALTDTSVPGRVRLFERWETKEALLTHLGAMAQNPPPDQGSVARVEVELLQYEIAAVGPLGS